MDFTRKKAADISQRQPAIFLRDSPLFRDDNPKKNITLAVLTFPVLKKRERILAFSGSARSSKSFLSWVSIVIIFFHPVYFWLKKDFDSLTFHAKV